MKVHVFTQSIKMGKYGGGVGFRVVAEALPLIYISLSRKEGKCLFPLDRLWEHDGHAPTFTSLPKRAAYTKRVVDEIHLTLTESLMQPWYETSYTQITTEDGTTWETKATLDINPPLKINAPPQKFHGAPEKGENVVMSGGTLVDTPVPDWDKTTSAPDWETYTPPTPENDDTKPINPSLITGTLDCEPLDDPPHFKEDGEV